jgi:hypothetical protein
MLSFQEFFTACAGVWKTERTYHSPLSGEVERSYTEYQAAPLMLPDKQQILALAGSYGSKGIQINPVAFAEADATCPGFSISFNTVSERGEQVSMNLKALFVPDSCVLNLPDIPAAPLPPAAEGLVEIDDLVQGFYLRDEGYSEAGAIAGRFTYQPMRQTLEMTTYYKRSVAVDQMRLISPTMRLRTIVTYQRPQTAEPPHVIGLVGFGVEQKQSETV